MTDAHQEHLSVQLPSGLIECTTCHTVPNQVSDPGHLEENDLVWSGLAVADGAQPSFDGQRCHNVYCHGGTLPAGGASNQAPRWYGADETEAQCGTCHGVPPQTGAHPTHVATLASDSVVYGDLRATADIAPTPPTYYFGCGNCHPVDEARHLDGVVEVELAAESMPAGSLRAANGPAAAYSSGTCSSVYCHSDGRADPLFVATPAWEGGSLEGCADCHENPPGYVSGEPGSATSNSHVLISAWSTTRLGGHFDSLPGLRHEVSSIFDASHEEQTASPITCQACHFASVDVANVGPSGLYYLDTSGIYELPDAEPYSCTAALCHTGAAGEGPIGTGKINPVAHVNAIRDVVFDPRTEIPAAATHLPADPNRPSYPYWIEGFAPQTLTPDSTVDGATWSFHLNNATYDPATKRCANIGCHMNPSFDENRTLQWGGRFEGADVCLGCHS